MDIDQIFDALNRHQVAYLLIGGMNFFLRHSPVVTMDIDLWIDGTAENRGRCEQALAELDAEWGPTETDWLPVARLTPDWLSRQALFCLTSPHGSIDIFRSVRGLGDWTQSAARAEKRATSAGVPYLALCDADMLQCQLALPEDSQKLDRIRTLKKSLEGGCP